MKKILCVVIYTILLFTFILGQEELKQTPETAKEQIQKEKTAISENWKIYKYENDSLEVALPSKPTYEAETIKNEFLESTLHTYTSEYKNQFYLFSYLKLDDEIDFSEVTDSLYAGWVEGIKETFKTAKITTKKDEFLKSEAMVLDLEGGEFKGKGVGVFIDGTMLQMFILQIKDAEVFDNDFFKSSVNKFFSSVKIRKILNRQIDSSGIVNNVFKSDLYKFEITLPDNWYEITSSQTNRIRKGIEQDKRINREGQRVVERSFNNSKFLFRLSKKRIGLSKNASFLGVVERIPPTRASSRMIALATQANFKNNMGYRIVTRTRKAYLGGRLFYFIKISKTFADTTVYQNVYIRKINRRQVLQFGLTYTTNEELKEMDDSLKTLKFFK